MIRIRFANRRARQERPLTETTKDSPGVAEARTDRASRGKVATLRRAGGYIATLAVVAIAIVWFFVFRPTFMGGPASYITVSGISMQPTYRSGDLVVVKARDHYAPGDIVAYRIPNGDVGAGSIIIHRIVGQDARGYITKGDNRTGEDLWRPGDATILGAAWIHVPGGGTLLLNLRSPLVSASLAAAFAMYVVLSGGAGDREPKKRRGAGALREQL